MNAPAESFTECYKCKSSNPSDKKFCGDCGASLDPTVGAINAYLDANLAKRLDEAIKVRFRDQQVTEVALAANVAEKVTNWAKLFVILIGVPLTIMGTYLTYLGINYKDSLKEAKTAIDQAIKSHRHDVDELNKRLETSRTGANDIEQQETILREKLNESSALLKQVPSLVKKVDNLEGQIQGLGANLVPQALKEGKALGVDVTNHNHVEWHDLQSVGLVSFAYIRATQGKEFVDPKFNENWQQAKRVGILRGAYHFLTGGDAVGQAENFVQHLHLEQGDLPPAVDFERFPFGPAATSADLRLFLKLVEQKTNCTPVIYSGNALIGLFSSSDRKVIGRYPLWLAHYASSLSVPSPWTSWTFWQFTDALTIKGLPALDFSEFNGSDSDLRAFAKRSCAEPHS
jgi:lysozyme